jgi:hypothetical protein
MKARWIVIPGILAGGAAFSLAVALFAAAMLVVGGPGSCTPSDTSSAPPPSTPITKQG